MNDFNDFSIYLHKNTNAIATEIVEGVLYKLKLNISPKEKEQAIDMYIELLGFFAESLTAKCKDKEELPDTLIQWSKNNAEMQVSTGGEISEIVVRYPPTREVLSDILTQISIDLNLSIKENAFIIKRVNSLLDVSLNETVYAFERLSMQYKERTEQEIAELSAPIVPIKENTVILPLIGEFDTNRTDHIMKYVVPEIVNMDTDYVIADFSGMLTLNLETASSLHQIGSMLRLMGIQVITTGMRPDLIQIVVTSGIDMSSSHIYADVKQALETIELI